MAQANKQLEDYEFDIKKMQRMKKENKLQNKHIEELGLQIKRTQDQFSGISEEYEHMINDYENTKEESKNKDHELVLASMKIKDLEDRIDLILKNQQENTYKMENTTKDNDVQEKLAQKYKKQYKIAKSEIRCLNDE